MFGFLGLSLETVLTLRGSWPGPIFELEHVFQFLLLTPILPEERYHIYMADNSRISIAGLNPNNVEYVARSITECLRNLQ